MFFNGEIFKNVANYIDILYILTFETNNVITTVVEITNITFPEESIKGLLYDCVLLNE